MFTGIIEALGNIVDIQHEGGNIHFTVASSLCNELKIDQSVSHDGVCLTVVALDSSKSTHTLTAIHETLEKTNLKSWKVGRKVNLERCMIMNGRLDGHIVQGHVDQKALCIGKEDQDGSWLFTFEHGKEGHITVAKGSICINGVSLTVVNSMDSQFSVAIIPYTYEHTVFHQIEPGDEVNLEFDIIGKYVEKLMQRS